MITDDRRKTPEDRREQDRPSPERRKGGRPPKPESERLSEQLPLRATKEEADLVILRARRMGLTTCAYLRLKMREVLAAEVDNNGNPTVSA